MVLCIYHIIPDVLYSIKISTENLKNRIITETFVFQIHCLF